MQIPGGYDQLVEDVQLYYIKAGPQPLDQVELGA
jgi:hypothetical protein